MAVVVALAAQKGGVGKTTATLGYAAVAAELGKRVLVIDADPQANASAALLPADMPAGHLTLHDVLHATPDKGAAIDAIVASAWEGIDVLPSEARRLASVESDASIGVEQRLRRGMDGVADGYDLVLIDCPPSLGRLSANALIAATHVLVICEPGLASLAGVGQTLSTVQQVQDAYRDDLVVAGIVVNRLEAHIGEQAARYAEIQESLGELVWSPAIPKRSAFAAAYGAGEPITQVAKGSVRTDVLGALLPHVERLLALNVLTSTRKQN